MEELMGDIISIVENDFYPREDKQKAMSRLERAIKSFFDASGACGTCFGKGYVENVGAPNTIPCTCARGEQIKKRFTPRGSVVLNTT